MSIKDDNINKFLNDLSKMSKLFRYSLNATMKEMIKIFNDELYRNLSYDELYRNLSCVPEHPPEVEELVGINLARRMIEDSRLKK